MKDLSETVNRIQNVHLTAGYLVGIFAGFCLVALGIALISKKNGTTDGLVCSFGGFLLILLILLLARME